MDRSRFYAGSGPFTDWRGLSGAAPSRLAWMSATTAIIKCASNQSIFFLEPDETTCKMPWSRAGWPVAWMP